MDAAQPLRFHWYRVPVVWIAFLALLGSLIGCLITVGVAQRFSDTSLSEVAPASRFSLPMNGRENPPGQHEQ